ncbi:hypothetical protein [Amycolatopsis echigonensis]|uniref:Uncharacterized protein n=1 Tax=Amycolatopsis echigonensis TaxID=2576905 RepID=A0A8E2B8M4_9PSEU|nr:hypothetical protein [Amycolatopsis echigonensis]MBB2506009.1 hypothetical protein [Amycolatopsis echigonensis]
MTTATLDLDGALARADRRYATRFGDDPAPREYLDALANAVRPFLTEPKTSRDSAPDSERETALASVAAELRVDNARLADQLQAEQDKTKRLTAELEQARAAIEGKNEALREHAATVERLRAELADAERDRDAAHAALDEQDAARVEPHQHRYPWPDPSRLPEPCECGREYPRAVPPPTRAAADPEPEPWGGLLGQVRGELRGWPAA